MMTQEQAFTPQALELASRQNSEPDWLLELRLKALQAFHELPVELPKDSPLEKHYTDLRKLELEKFEPLAFNGYGVTSGDFPREILRETKQKSYATLVMHNSKTALAYPESLARQGVIFTDLRTAIREHSELVKRHLFTECHSFSDFKLAALHAAYMANGVFLYVPEGVDAVLPFRAVYNTAAPGKAAFYHNLVVLEENAKASFSDEYYSIGATGDFWHSAMTEVIASKGSTFSQHSLQDLSHELAFNYDSKKAVLAGNASVDWVFASLGGKTNLTRVESVLNGRGARSDNLGVFLGRGEQHVDVSANVNHRVRDTDTRILLKGVISGKTTSVARGMIKIGETSNNSNSDLKATTLVLSDSAKANAIPALDIRTNDVRAKHAAFIDHLDEEQVFYLMSRGLERRAAERQVIGGYYNQVLDSIKVPGVREAFRNAVNSRLEV